MPRDFRQEHRQRSAKLIFTAAWMAPDLRAEFDRLRAERGLTLAAALREAVAQWNRTEATHLKERPLA